MAFLGKKDFKMAKAELLSLDVLANDKSLEKMTIWEINSMSSIVQIGSKVLKAEILASERNYAQSINLLKKAVAIEDNLNYNEPPDWFFSVRHHLGAIQIEAGRFDDAVKTYEEDLRRLPKNGWAHHGLKLAYEKLNNKAKVKEMERLITKSWATADVKITTSRIK